MFKFNTFKNYEYKNFKTIGNNLIHSPVMILVSHKELATTDNKDIKVYDINTTECLYILSAHTD